jgi:dTDP-4-amino-4,6-dideoxygalactose transaminase
MHLQPVYADAPFYGDNTSGQLFEKGLCLPSSPVLAMEDIERVIHELHELARTDVKRQIDKAI